jgi:hypothetical protein
MTMSGEGIVETFSVLLGFLIASALVLLSLVLLAMRRFSDVMGSLPEVYFALVFLVWVLGGLIAHHREWTRFAEGVTVTAIQLALFLVIILAVSSVNAALPPRELVLPCVLMVTIQVGTGITARWHEFAASAVEQHPGSDREYKSSLRMQAFFYLSIPIGSGAGAILAHLRHLTVVDVFRTELASVLACASVSALVSLVRVARLVASPLVAEAKAEGVRQVWRISEGPLPQSAEDAAVDAIRLRTVYLLNGILSLLCLALMAPQVVMLLDALGAMPARMSRWFAHPVEASATYFVMILGLALLCCLLPCEFGDRETFEALTRGQHGKRLSNSLAQLASLEKNKMHRRLISLVVPLGSAIVGKLIDIAFKSG